MPIANLGMLPSIAIKVGTVELDNHDLQTLKPGQWINDGVIMAYANLAALESMQHEYRNSSRTILLLDTRFAHKLAHYCAYKEISGIVQFQEVRLFASLTPFPLLTFIGSQICCSQVQHHLPSTFPLQQPLGLYYHRPSGCHHAFPGFSPPS